MIEAAIIAITVLFLLIFTLFGHWQHAFMAVMIILWTIPIGILVYFDRTTFMEFKHRIVLYMMAVLLLVQCVMAFCYIFGSQQDYCNWSGGMWIDGKVKILFSFFPKKKLTKKLNILYSFSK